MLQSLMKRSRFFYKCMEFPKCQHYHFEKVIVKNFHFSPCLRLPKETKHTPSPAIANKYTVITDDNSSVIENTADEIYASTLESYGDEFEGISLERGETGVFSIEQLVDILQRENAKNIFVATVPQEINYVDHIVIVSGRSDRHILALAEFVRKVFKQKRHETDMIPRIEGKNSNEWMALDLGNIALHIFSEKTRKVYDLETLWAVGREYDEQMNKKSDIVDIFENYSAYLKDLKPLA